MDFSAFYTAGEAMSAGLSPYESHYTTSPPIWDGVGSYDHSRFLYPPLVADFFRLLAALPYHVAKYVWMIMNLLAVLTSLFLATRASKIDLSENLKLLPTLLLLLFHPLLTLLERGQIDGITLLLVTTAFYLICAKKHQSAAGVLISLATLLKLHAVLVLPFLAVRRKWEVLAGYAGGVSIIILLSLVISGPQTLTRYLTVEFPRISKFGQAGREDMRVETSLISSLRPDRESTTKDGRTYAAAQFEFVTNASVVRTPLGRLIRRLLLALNLPNSKSIVSLLVFSGSFGLIFLLHWRAGFAMSVQSSDEFLYWQLVLVVVLLSAPLTWVMNTVWLVTLLPFAVNGLSMSEPSCRRAALIMILLGLFAAALPDHRTFHLLFSFGALDHLIGPYKYVIAELSIAAGLMLRLGLFQGSAKASRHN